MKMFLGYGGPPKRGRLSRSRMRKADTTTDGATRPLLRRRLKQSAEDDEGTATPGRSATGRVDQPAGREIDRSGWPRINDRHLARPVRVDRIADVVGRTGSLTPETDAPLNYCALGVSMSLTGSGVAPAQATPIT